MNNHQWESIFNRDFYPTPIEVIEAMQIDCNGLKVLEPSAGKGNIIDYLKDNGAAEVFYCEINKDLSEICKNKATFLCNDFLELRQEQISHIDLIVMNPPFTKYRQHIEHAFNIAKDGCTIISLCNSDSLSNLKRYSEMNDIIRNHSNVYELGQVFQNAERQTNVDITCIHIFKPNYNNETEFDGFYMGEDEDYYSNENELVTFDEVRSYVNSYVGALKCFDKFTEVNNEMSSICAKFKLQDGFTYKLSYNNEVKNKNQFAKELQRIAWKQIFSKMNMEKYMTRGVMSDINRFIENQSNVPFTRRNIFKMIEIIFGTRNHNMNRALVEAVDNFTKYTHDNRFGVEGWKTNSGHLLNKKIIIDWMFERAYGNKSKVKLRYGSHADMLEDLIKVIYNLRGYKYEDHKQLHNFVLDENGLFAGEWYSWDLFEIKAFKKGTIHIKFKNEDDWWALNKKYGEIKGFTLPEKI
jgi:predicted RNA methylase